MNASLTPDPSLRTRLNAVKLATLVREHLGTAEFTPHEFAGGAALVHGAQGWVLVDTLSGHAPGLGGPLAWAHQRGVTEVHVVADADAGVLARRAAGFRLAVTVWSVDGRSLIPATPEPLTMSVPAPAHHLQFLDDIVGAGAEPVVEHGVLAGEIEGLEMCRVVDDPDTGEVRLEVGVGAHDREAFQMLHGNRPAFEPLSTVADAVRRHRQPLDPSHPLGRLALERALRARLVRTPALIGATSVVTAPPPVPRRNLKDATPCAALAIVDGEQVAVVCSVGIDLDAVPFAVDTCAVLGVTRGLVVMPSRDAMPLQHRLAAGAVPQLTVVPVELAT